MTFQRHVFGHLFFNLRVLRVIFCGPPIAAAPADGFSHTMPTILTILRILLFLQPAKRSRAKRLRDPLERFTPVVSSWYVVLLYTSRTFILWGYLPHSYQKKNSGGRLPQTASADCAPLIQTS